MNVAIRAWRKGVDSHALHVKHLVAQYITDGTQFASVTKTGA
jgi:hypothetical protein